MGRDSCPGEKLRGSETGGVQDQQGGALGKTNAQQAAPEFCFCFPGSQGRIRDNHHQPKEKDTKAPKEGLFLSIVGGPVRANMMSFGHYRLPSAWHVVDVQ